MSGLVLDWAGVLWVSHAVSEHTVLEWRRAAGWLSPAENQALNRVAAPTPLTRWWAGGGRLTWLEQRRQGEARGGEERFGAGKPNGTLREVPGRFST